MEAYKKLSPCFDAGESFCINKFCFFRKAHKIIISQFLRLCKEKFAVEMEFLCFKQKNIVNFLQITDCKIQKVVL